MVKFKVGDKVRVREDLEVNKIYGDFLFNKEMSAFKGNVILIRKVDEDGYNLENNNWFWTDEMLEAVKEDKMEKTFREVIADIKPGEVWECTRENARVREIKMHEEGHTNLIVFNFGQMTSDVRASIQGGDRFILKRKEYTFEEAFKAYEEGKEIESYKYRYKKIDGRDCFWSEFNAEWDDSLEQELDFEMKEIRGKWYIND